MTNEDVRVLHNLAVECLQTAFEADPVAMYALTTNRVPCTQALADHEFVIVDQPPVLQSGSEMVGMMGVLNGILSAMAIPKIAYKMSEQRDEDGRSKFLGFTTYQEQGTE